MNVEPVAQHTSPTGFRVLHNEHFTYFDKQKWRPTLFPLRLKAGKISGARKLLLSALLYTIPAMFHWKNVAFRKQSLPTWWAIFLCANFFSSTSGLRKERSALEASSLNEKQFSVLSSWPGEKSRIVFRQHRTLPSPYVAEMIPARMRHGYWAFEQRRPNAEPEIVFLKEQVL